MAYSIVKPQQNYRKEFIIIPVEGYMVRNNMVVNGCINNRTMLGLPAAGDHLETEIDNMGEGAIILICECCELRFLCPISEFIFGGSHV